MNTGAGVPAERWYAATGRRGLSWAIIVAIWLPVLGRLRPAWASVEQAHGWAVPLLALMLTYDRRGGERGTTSGALDATNGRWVAWSAMVAGFMTLPVLLAVLTANPLWPAAQWLTFGAAALATLGWRAIDGGGSAARRALFPVLFLSTALTWPTFLALRTSTGLAALNARLAATVVSAIGFPAVVHGNVIEVSSGLVGVDEACSGVRSLPAVWMAAWFFGELHRLNWRRRLALVAASLLAAVVGNLIRTSTLTWLAASHGVTAVDHWHDTAGMLELVGTLLTVTALAAWLARRRTTISERSSTEGPATSYAVRPAAPVVLALALVVAALPSLWYHWRTPVTEQSGRRWMLRRPPDWEPLVVPAAAQSLLRASAADGAQRFDPQLGGRDVVFVLRWDGDVGSAAAAELHDPTLCLPAAGVAVDTDLPGETVSVSGRPIAFTTGRFNVGGETQHVFYCRWDNELGRARSARPQDLADVTRWRLERVWQGQAHGAVEFIVFIVPAANDTLARSWLRTWAPRLLEAR